MNSILSEKSLLLTLNFTSNPSREINRYVLHHYLDIAQDGSKVKKRGQKCKYQKNKCFKIKQGFIGKTIKTITFEVLKAVRMLMAVLQVLMWCGL
jgi:hypothetical protein